MIGFMIPMYELKNFKLENINVVAKDNYNGYDAVNNLILNDVKVR